MSLAQGFDPLEGVPLAQFARPADLHPLNLRVLSPFQRALLAIDGTVTRFIEAYTLEPLEIVLVSGARQRLAEDYVWLDAPRGTRIAARRVLIRGRYSSTPYVYAVSLVVLGRLPATVRHRLEQDGTGLGRLLEEAQMETRREVLWFGRERVDGLPDVMGPNAGDFLSRMYRIIAHGRPIALINERFPSCAEVQPSRH